MKRLIYVKTILNLFKYVENVKSKGVEKKGFTREWLEYRIGIFMNYPLKSMVNQTDQNFVCRVIYDESSDEIVRDILSSYPKLPDNVVFISRKKSYGDLYNLIKDYEEFYLVRWDSDDMYRGDYIQKLRDYKHKDGTVALVNTLGYIYDSINNRMIEFYHESPPFFTYIYKVSDYLENLRYTTERGHTGVIKLNHELLSDRNYIFHAHNENTIKKFGYFKQKDTLIIKKDEMEKILIEFKGENIDE